MQRSISPPRSRKRIRLGDSAELATCSARPSSDAITIYSWNVNGISPFLQPSIASYFNSSAGQQSSQGSAKASLRDFLRRHGWPSLLFLQEVKINPDDSATKRAVEKAVRRPPSEPLDAYDYEARTYALGCIICLRQVFSIPNPTRLLPAKRQVQCSWFRQEGLRRVQHCAQGLQREVR